MATRAKREKAGEAKAFAPPKINVRVVFGLSFDYSVGEYSFSSSDHMSEGDVQDLVDSYDGLMPEEIAVAEWPCGHQEVFKIDRAGAIADALELVITRKSKSVDVDGGFQEFTFSEPDYPDEDKKEDETEIEVSSGGDVSEITRAVAKRMVLVLRTIDRALPPKTKRDQIGRAAVAQVNAAVREAKKARVAARKKGKK